MALSKGDVDHLLSYDPSTGVFIWRVTTYHKRHIGRVAGRIGNRGHRMIGVYGKHYAAHRLAWLVMTGRWPRETIDHINREKDDNRFCNLREASIAQNSHNTGKTRKGTSSRFKGVTWNKNAGRWQAAINHKYLGVFTTEEEAAAAYAMAAIVHHREFACVSNLEAAE